jgi:hypothetical protein
LAAQTGIGRAGMGRGSVFPPMAMLGAHVAATAAMAARRSLVGMSELLVLRVFLVGGPPMLWVQFACGGVGRRGPPPWGLYVVV